MTTRNILILLTALIVMCLCVETVFAESITTKDYFVLCDGTMAFTGSSQVVTTESASSRCNLISEPVFGVNYPGYPHRFFNYDSEGNLMFYGAYFGSEYIYMSPSGGVQWLPGELEIGSTYTSTWSRDEYTYSDCGYSGVGSDSLSITVTGPETVTVPAGTFVTYKLVYVDRWQTGQGSTGVSKFTYWLAKDVGWVKIILGGVTYELMSHKGPPSAPHLSVTTSGITVSLSWTARVSADGYILFYAPAPYTGPDSIGSFDMGSQTGCSFSLWEGASFYVAVQAYNSFGNSGLSNIGHFNIGYVLSVSPASLSFLAGQTGSCTISGGTSPYSASSSNTSVATVSVSGNTLAVAGVSEGSAVITVYDSSSDSVGVNVTVTSDTVYDYAADYGKGMVNGDVDYLMDRTSAAYLHYGMDQACRRSMFEWRFFNWEYLSHTLNIKSVKDVSQGGKTLVQIEGEFSYTIKEVGGDGPYEYIFYKQITLILEDGKWKCYGNQEGYPSPSVSNLIACNSVVKGQPGESKTKFSSQDPAVYVYFEYTGMYTGDKMTYKWYFPSGALYWEDSWDFKWDKFPVCGVRNGPAWVWFAIDGYESWWGENAGRWKVEIFINSTLVGRIYFDYGS